MNRATNEFVANLVPNHLDAMEISGTAWRDAGFRSYEHVAYPDFDICRDRTTRTYDIIIAEQVFEHIRRPDRAARNVRAMLRRNGVFVITTPFLIRDHPELLDLWRWTAERLKALLEDAGFSTVAAHSWGSRACVAGNFDTWPDYMPELHSLENELEFPIVVWAFARRDAPQTPLDRLVAYGKTIRRRMAHRPDRHVARSMIPSGEMIGIRCPPSVMAGAGRPSTTSLLGAQKSWLAVLRPP